MPKNKQKLAVMDGKGKKFLLGIKGMAGNKNLPFVPKPPILKPVALPPDAPSVQVPKNAKMTGTKKWCLRNTQVLRAVVEKRVGTGRSKSLLSSDEEAARPVNKYKVVDVVKQEVSTTWSAVSFESIAFELIDPIKRTRDWVTTRVTGWILNAHMDDFASEYPDTEVDIPHATPNSTDPQQYMTLEIDEEEKKFKSRIQTNMCGELSVAYVAKKDIDIVLTDWKAKPGSSFKSLLGMGKNSTTRPRHVKEILDIYFPGTGDQKKVEPYIEVTQTIPPVINRIPLAAPDAPHRASDDFRKKLKTHDFITLVRIDTNTGELIRTFNPGDRNHWVVVTRTMRNGHRVELYNPFPNRRQAYSFGEFNASVGSNPQSGWWVKRKKSMNEKPFTPPVLGVAAINPTSTTIDAEQYVFIEGGGVEPKNNLCGQFSTAFIIGSSMSASLENWKARQKTQPAGLWELTNMLDAYGFNNKDGKRSFSIDTLLHYWKKIQPNLHAATVGGDTDEGTDLLDLMSILRAYGYRREDMSLERPGGTPEPLLFAPARDAKPLKKYFLIAGVVISGRTGRLKNKLDGGVEHWVVVNSIDPNGNQFGGGGGWVELYNPFMNCWEEYSLGEFTKAFNGGTLWVKREITPAFKLETPAPPKVKIKQNLAFKPGKSGKGKGKDKIKVFSVQDILKEFNRLIKQPNALLGEVIRKLANLSGLDKNEIRRIVSAGKTDGKPSVDLEKLLSDHLGVKSVPEVVIRWIHEKAGEDETYATQLADTFRRFGILIVKGKSCSMTNLEKFDPAAQLKSVIGKPRAPAKLDVRDRRALLLREGSQITFEVSTLAAKPFVSKSVTELKATVAKIAEEQPKNIMISRAKPRHGIKPRDKYLKWIKRLEAKDPVKYYRVRIWGDPVMVELGFDINGDTSAEEAPKNKAHFQAVGLYNKLTGFGAITNHVDILRDDIDNLLEMQVDEEFDGKTITQIKKMNWLCSHRGKIFMYDDASAHWTRAQGIRWGTIALGGNLVQIERFEKIETKLPGEKVKRVHEMGRLVGFRKKDWSRPVDELLSEGLVHRCFCVYKKNGFGDIPNKGIGFSPLFSPLDWSFNGNKKIDALYIPRVYLEEKKG
ncbi:MAG TPA: hypothetical protein VMJ90_03530 [Anaerolineales bacterium]|nr:hypothetical protein [Anaerolineales bacterium]